MLASGKQAWVYLDARSAKSGQHLTAPAKHGSIPREAQRMSYIRVTAILVLAVIGGVARVEVRPGGQTSPAESPKWATKALRAGIIGTDTSHVPAFTATFAAHPEWKIKVVAAFKGGSPDLPTSANRVDGFAKTIQDKHGVEIVDSIEALLAKVDVVLLESVDGRPHLAQVTPVLKAGKPVFVDKPLAASLEDARRILQIARETGTPLFSSSSSRFHSEIARLRDNPGVGKVTRVQASYTLSPLAFHPDLYFYGIHGVEALYAVMGTGCVAVSRKIEGNTDITTCKWKDGRVGVYHGILKTGEKLPMIQVSGDKGTAASSGSEGYEGLVKVIAEFFQTGRPPFDPAQTLEVFEFMTAAQLSKERGGAEVPLAELRR
jgi:predicted dehydrogenase